MEIEFEKWLYVKCDSAETARAFFGMPADWPAEFDRFETRPDRAPGRIYRVLSDAWIRQQNKRA